jgi:hypothetical protein
LASAAASIPWPVLKCGSASIVRRAAVAFSSQRPANSLLGQKNANLGAAAHLFRRIRGTAIAYGQAVSAQCKRA